MTISQTPFLSKPTGDDRIPSAALAYIKARGRQQAFNLVHSELKRSGISQATLTRRLGKSPEVISRLLKRPGNWEQDTISEILFAICGASYDYDLQYPNAATERWEQPIVSGGGQKNPFDRLLETNTIQVSPPDRTTGTAQRVMERAS
jgi:hypothetical protein